MNKLAIIGFGGVGRALARLAKEKFSVELIADRSGYVLGPFSSEQLDILIEQKAAGAKLADLAGGSTGQWFGALSEGALIADTTADETGSVLVQCVERGHRVALANKKPLCGSLKQFQTLVGAEMTRHEATVGAGLPVIVTTNMLRDTGDLVERVEGCLSGTLGYLLSELEAGRLYSKTVQVARERGWTEPDPRDDLGGVDVARKGLILARLLGCHVELSDVEIEPLFPTDLAQGSVDDFMAALPQLDDEMADRMAAAARQGKTLRYVATVTPESITVGLREVEKSSPLGSLQGPDNMVTWTTQNYREQPLVVRGPGAGVEVTAGAVLFDLLALEKQG